MSRLTETERQEGYRRHRWKFDGTLTLGNVLTIILLALGGIGLYIRGVERDTQQDANIERWGAAIETIQLQIGNLDGVDGRLDGALGDIDNRLNRVETQLNWATSALRRIEDRLIGNGGQQ